MWEGNRPWMADWEEAGKAQGYLSHFHHKLLILWGEKGEKEQWKKLQMWKVRDDLIYLLLQKRPSIPPQCPHLSMPSPSLKAHSSKRPRKHPTSMKCSCYRHKEGVCHTNNTTKNVALTRYLLTLPAQSLSIGLHPVPLTSCINYSQKAHNTTQVVFIFFTPRPCVH